MEETYRLYDKLTREELRDLGVVLGPVQALRGRRRDMIAYVIMNITRSKHYYETLAKEGVRNEAELNKKLGADAFWNLIVRPKIQDGIAVADQLGKEKELLYYAPSVFNAAPWRWTQDAYMALSYNVVVQVAGRAYASNGWEYSTGGVLEFFLVMLLQWRYIRWFNKDAAARIFGLEELFAGLTDLQTQQLLEELWKLRVYDTSHQEVRLDEGMLLIANAIEYIHGLGLDYPPELYNVAWKLKQLPMLSPFMGDGPYEWRTERYREALDKLERLKPAN